MKAIAYTRVSTLDQASNGASLDAQRAKIQAWCVFKDIELIGIETDAGISAKSIKGRPGLQSVLNQLEDVEFLITPSLSRLTRSTEDLCQLIRVLDKSDVSLVSLAENIDASTAMGRAMIKMIGVINELERELVSERTTETMAHLISQGRVFGHPAFGYSLDENGTLEQQPEEQAIASQIVEMRQQGLSYRTIAAQLNDAETPTKKGSNWHAMSVQRVCERAFVTSGNGSVTAAV
jgi:DNA invertase Pin-like site-specific DNA recombinase